MAKIIQAGDLRNRINFYVVTTTTQAPATPSPTPTPQEGQNELGEDITTTTEVPNQNDMGEDVQGLELYAESIPAQILPMNGMNQHALGDLDMTTVTHKIRIRAGAVSMRPDLVIMYEGQRYDVRYWQPVYNNSRFMEIMTVLEVNV